MKSGEFEREWRERLKENRKLTEHPYLPESAFFLAAFVGRHLFSVTLVLAAILATITMTKFSLQIKWINAVMLFL